MFPYLSRAVGRVPPRWRGRDGYLALGALLVIAWSCLQLLLFGFGRDQSIYAEVGSQLLEGQMPYRDVWDFKPPGIFLVFALAQALFGKAMWAPRVLEVACLVGSVAAYARVTRVMLGSALPGLMGGALAALLHAQLEFWHSGQPESFGGFLVAAALWACAEATVRRPRAAQDEGGVDASPRAAWWWALSALSFGAAVLFKPPLAGGVVVCASYLALRRHRLSRDGRGQARALRVVAVMAACSLLPVLLCSWWLWARGAWGAVHWTFFEFAPGYTGLGWQNAAPLPLLYYAGVELVFKFSALAAVGLFAVLILRAIHSRERELLLLVFGVLAMQLVGIVMQAKFFQYHYAASLSLLGLVAGVGWYKLARRLQLIAWGGGVLLLALVVAGSLKVGVVDVPGSFWQRSAMRTAYAMGLSDVQSRAALNRELYYVADYNLDADARVARYLKANGAPRAGLFVWGFEPLIYWLSDSRAVSRFIYNVPQRTGWEQKRARSLLLEELRRDLPGWLVVQHNDVFPNVTGDSLDSKQALEYFPELQQLVVQRYALTKRIEDFDIYQLGPPTRVASEDHADTH